VIGVTSVVSRNVAFGHRNPAPRGTRLGSLGFGPGAVLEHSPGMNRCLGLALCLAAFASGCAQSTAPASTAPDLQPADALVEGLPTAPNVRFDRLPQAAPCETDQDAEDTRCPADVLHAAAMSWLGKTAAEYDGVSMHVIAYDPAQIQAEARADAAFAEMLLAADTSPRDGRLDRVEATALEDRVLSLLDPRVAAR
jgi:hypothetical protein